MPKYRRIDERLRTDQKKLEGELADMMSRSPAMRTFVMKQMEWFDTIGALAKISDDNTARKGCERMVNGLELLMKLTEKE